MKTFQTLLATALGAVVFTTQAQTRSGEPQIGAAVAAFEMSYAKRAPDEIAKRLHLLAKAMTGKSLRAVEIEKFAQSTESAWAAPFPDAPQLRVRYLPAVDELRLLDEQATLNLEPKSPIDEFTALKTAGQTIEQLAAFGLIDARHYDLKRAQVGYHRALAGPNTTGKPQVNQVTEYRITLRPALNGIEVATAGLRIGVHASGQVISLRLGGASMNTTVKDGFDLPTGEGKYLTRRLSNEELDQRFLKSMPITAKPTVHWSRLMYAMPDGATRAVVEPLRIYAYSLTTEVDGHPVVSRRKLVGFSATDNEANPLDYTAPTPAVKEGSRLR